MHHRFKGSRPALKKPAREGVKKGEGERENRLSLTHYGLLLASGTIGFIAGAFLFKFKKL
jgi:hypothetical protein